MHESEQCMRVSDQRDVYERCSSMSADGQGAGSPTIVIGGAREVHENDWCMSINGAREVHQRYTNMRRMRLSSARD